MSDNCCPTCKSTFGICLTGYKCQHHVEARLTEDADDRARRLYNNPTQDRAIENVMREQRQARRRPG